MPGRVTQDLRGASLGAQQLGPRLQCGRHRFNPRVRKIPWRREWQPTAVFLPGESHRQGSLAGYIVHGIPESDTTEQLHFHFSLIKKIIFMGPIYLKKFLIGTFIL